MEQNSKYEWKVGMFVLCGIVLIGALLFNFSKGASFFQPTYQLNVVMHTVAGLKPKAEVMMSGIPVGSVVSTDLGSGATNVIIHVRILSKYKIRSTANFHVDALGFLGDQYIEITPDGSSGDFLADGATVNGEAPFDLQQAVRSSADLLQQASRTLHNLDRAISNVNETILSQSMLNNFTNALVNIQDVSQAAARMSVKFEHLLDSNAVPISVTLSNLASVSSKLDAFADDLSVTFSTNRSDITGSIRDFRQTAANFRQISDDLEAGKGLAGGALKDEVMRAQTQAAISNIDQLAVSLRLFSTRLNENGLWGSLWKPKDAPTNKSKSTFHK